MNAVRPTSSSRPSGEWKLALLGDDPRAESLLQAFLGPRAEQGRVTLVAAVAAPRTLESLRAAGFSVPAAEEGANLLMPGRIDAAIVATDDQRLLELAHRLAAGTPLLVLPLTGQTTAFAYELTLLQADSQTLLVPLFAWRAHSQIQRVQELLTRGALGSVQHVELERKVRPAGADGRLAARRAADDFLEDIDLLRLLLGEIGHVTAVRTGAVEGSFWSQTVTLGTKAGVPATWSLVADPEKESWRLTLSSTAGRVILEGDPARQHLTCTVTGVAGEATATSAEQDPGAWWRDRFLEAIDSGSGRSPDRGGIPAADWTDFTRAFEIQEGIERSVRRRRTIDLEFDIPSERSQFKTHMTATGCSLLILTLLAVVGFLLGAQLLGLSPPTTRPSKAAAGQKADRPPLANEEGPNYKRIAAVATIFLPLSLFLGLQIFYFIARPRPDSAGKTAAAKARGTAPPD